MRVLVLGGTGMLGHKLALELADGHDLTVTTRSGETLLRDRPEFAAIDIVAFDKFNDDEALAGLLDHAKPDLVLNAIGIIKQNEAHRLEHVEINAALPQRMALLCARREIRFITFGTDCIFDGTAGRPYRQDEKPTAHDVYGMTKYLGEIPDNPFALTIRTSIIGPELKGRKSLLAWVLASRGQTVSGYTGALYTGLPTLEMAVVVRLLMDRHPALSGIWQVTSPAIDKASLIRLIDRQFELGITVRDNDDFTCDRRLDGSEFTDATGYRAPGWDTLVASMHNDYLRYRGLYES